MDNNEIEKWANSQEYQVQFNSQGKIIDYLNHEIVREDTPEERIRQKTIYILNAEYGYPREVIAVERTINIGREKKRADIVIYKDKYALQNNDQGNIILISEIKSPIIKSYDGQLDSYISATSAQGGFWTNGSSIEFFRKDNENQNILKWLGIPKYGYAWDSIGKYKKSELVKPVDLKLAFLRCHNAIYRSGIDSEDVALDMVRIILSKFEDETSSDEECEFHISPEEYHDEELKKIACIRVRNLFNKVRERYPDVFQPYEEITASDNQLAIVISYLQQYSFLDASYDIIGTAYEIYVASHLKGERGQFFTNRLVVDMMIRIINPNDKDIILDPACGTGGFLIGTMNYIFENIDISKRTKEAKEILKRNVVHQIFGVDISPKLVKIAKANMLLGKDGHGGIEHGNSLDAVTKLTPNIQEKAGLNKPTVILTNPPFGSSHEIRIKDIKLLTQYESGYSWSVTDKGDVDYAQEINSKQGVAPELLFLEKCIQWIKPGGKIGIVMAKGQLDNREAYAIRKFVLKNTQILAIVNLHEDTFEPFCGSKASVIFLQKPINALSKNYKIYMAISNKIGQTSRGEIILKKDKEGTPIIKNGIHLLDEDLSIIADDYNNFINNNLKVSSFRFSIEINDIDPSNLSFNPIRYLPRHNEMLKKVLNLGDNEDFELHRLGDLGDVFNGPRFKRPYADFGITDGPTIRKYFTGTAITQLNSDNIKYLDSSKAEKQTQKHLDALTIYKGYIVISDSGTLGRVTYVLNQHNGHVATNNLIRVVIKDENLRGYVFQFLNSSIGQSLMLKSAYGTNQEHLEPDVISEIPIPVPKNREVIDRIGSAVISSIENLEESIEKNKLSMDLFQKLFE